jgi:hypothetical protein
MADLQRQLAECKATETEQAALISQLAYRDSAYEEGTAYQAATIDVLHVMSDARRSAASVRSDRRSRAVERSPLPTARPQYFLTCVKRLTQEYALAAQG